MLHNVYLYNMDRMHAGRTHVAFGQQLRYEFHLIPFSLLLRGYGLFLSSRFHKNKNLRLHHRFARGVH